mgnify:CR=1 FL=1
MVKVRLTKKEEEELRILKAKVLRDKDRYVSLPMFLKVIIRICREKMDKEFSA